MVSFVNTPIECLPFIFIRSIASPLKPSRLLYRTLFLPRRHFDVYTHRLLASYNTAVHSIF